MGAQENLLPGQEHITFCALWSNPRWNVFHFSTVLQFERVISWDYGFQHLSGESQMNRLTSAGLQPGVGLALRATAAASRLHDNR
jgi:hypothetical protein